MPVNRDGDSRASGITAQSDTDPDKSPQKIVLRIASRYPVVPAAARRRKLPHEPADHPLLDLSGHHLLGAGRPAHRPALAGADDAVRGDDGAAAAGAEPEPGAG